MPTEDYQIYQRRKRMVSIRRLLLVICIFVILGIGIGLNWIINPGSLIFERIMGWLIVVIGGTTVLLFLLVIILDLLKPEPRATPMPGDNLPSNVIPFRRKEGNNGRYK